MESRQGFLQDMTLVDDYITKRLMQKSTPLEEVIADTKEESLQEVCSEWYTSMKEFVASPADRLYHFLRYTSKHKFRVACNLFVKFFAVWCVHTVWHAASQRTPDPTVYAPSTRNTADAFDSARHLKQTGELLLRGGQSSLQQQRQQQQQHEAQTLDGRAKSLPFKPTEPRIPSYNSQVLENKSLADQSQLHEAAGGTRGSASNLNDHSLPFKAIEPQESLYIGSELLDSIELLAPSDGRDQFSAP